ncbi:MAG: bifunctional phosphopantothenoylcysteine decarboxylase/phosphopantothenate--cysteine ligase CoaBC, partial [Candidatus Lokiarchaeota archaeon]|nr:bifunctional phosphopantothenoylcysteine decarboxylase/phosphopantothenate--cysteine ligase CoaBC [Candidatus Lokiarchaeota archaeon]
AETNVSRTQLIDRAHERLLSSQADLIVANDVGRDDVGFGSKENEVYIINKEKQISHIEKNSKRYIASRILDITLENFRIRNIK